VEFIPVDVKVLELLVGHLDAPLVLVWVQPTLDAQPALGGRRLYQADDHRQRHQRPAAPDLADVAEHPVLNLVLQEVPGGRCETWISSPVSLESC